MSKSFTQARQPARSTPAQRLRTRRCLAAPYSLSFAQPPRGTRSGPQPARIGAFAWFVVTAHPSPICRVSRNRARRGLGRTPDLQPGATPGGTSHHRTARTTRGGALGNHPSRLCGTIKERKARSARRQSVSSRSASACALSAGVKGFRGPRAAVGAWVSS
jgi:hypothetical protein